jgi:hypothetical protein
VSGIEEGVGGGVGNLRDDLAHARGVALLRVEPEQLVQLPLRAPRRSAHAAGSARREGRQQGFACPAVASAARLRGRWMRGFG